MIPGSSWDPVSVRWPERTSIQIERRYQRGNQGSVGKEAVFTNYMLNGHGFQSPTRGNSIFFERWMLWWTFVLLLCRVALSCLVFQSISYNQQYRLANMLLCTCMPNQLHPNISCNWYLDWALPSQDCPRIVCVRETMVSQGSQSHLDPIGGQWSVIVKHTYWSEHSNSENLHLWIIALCRPPTHPHTTMMVTIYLQSSIPLFIWKQKINTLNKRKKLLK